jgi:hypothetical protein
LVYEASHYALTAGMPVTTVAMRARKFSITYTRPASPLSEKPAATPPRRVNRREYLKTSPFQTRSAAAPVPTITSSAEAALKRR